MSMADRTTEARIAAFPGANSGLTGLVIATLAGMATPGGPTAAGGRAGIAAGGLLLVAGQARW